MSKPRKSTVNTMIRWLREWFDGWYRPPVSTNERMNRLLGR